MPREGSHSASFTKMESQRGNRYRDAAAAATGAHRRKLLLLHGVTTRCRRRTTITAPVEESLIRLHVCVYIYIVYDVLCIIL